MVKFGFIDQDGVFHEIGEVEQENMRKCPHFIIEITHYRADGTCRCDDPSHLDMTAWGYTYDMELLRWV
jgi:hypothetical protein